MTSRTDKIVLGIDASRSVTSYKTGVENYSDEIILAILGTGAGGVADAGGATSGDFEVRLYTPSLIDKFPTGIQKVMWFPRLWTLVRLSFEMLVSAPDVLFVPAHVLPFFAPKRSFVTIHDIAFEKIPASYSRFKRWYLRWSTRRALALCEKIIVPSNAVKEDLVVAYDVTAEKIVVVWHGLKKLVDVDKKIIQCTLNEYNLSDKNPLFFYLGRIEKKKNVLVLFDAFCKVVEKFPNAQMVFGGGQGDLTGELMKKIYEYGLRGNVSYLGYLNEVEISVFFRTATAFVFPSLEEGFGLPILQAFSAGCPVICSDIPVLREVAGGAAIFVSPSDADGFAEAMMRVADGCVTDGVGGTCGAAVRDVLIKNGAKRLNDFSWGKAGKAVLKLFK